MARWKTDPVLSVERLTMRFGGLTAIASLSFDLGRKEITALIGPNGAGKTTVFNCVTGFYKPTEGFIRLRHSDGKEFLLERMDDYVITRTAKVARTFQNIRLFPGMTVLENLMVAQHNKLMVASGYTFGGLLGSPHYKKSENDAVDKAKYWLDLVKLMDRADDPAGDLSYGAQRRLEIARAMCTDPCLLCLDEPAAGLNPKESDELNKMLLKIRDEHDMSIILIEHDMSVVMGISDHVVVLDYGQKISDGTPSEVRNDPAVIRAYLGSDDKDELSISVPDPVLITRDLPPVVVNEKAAGVTHTPGEVSSESVYLADQTVATPIDAPLSSLEKIKFEPVSNKQDVRQASATKPSKPVTKSSAKPTVKKTSSGAEATKKPAKKTTAKKGGRK